MIQIPAIPTGPAWAVSLAMVFGGLALLLRSGAPIVQAIRRNGKNGQADELGRQEAVAELKAHIDAEAKESRERQERIMGNINDTRHALAQPLSTAALSLALIEQTLVEIRDRLPRL